MTATSCVHVDVDEILRATDAALLCRIGEEEIWLPKSQVANAEDYEEGDADLTLSITEWIAKQKGLNQ